MFEAQSSEGVRERESRLYPKGTEKEEREPFLRHLQILSFILPSF